MKNDILDYKEKLLKISEEMKIRENIGLMNNSMERYINALKINFPNEYKFILDLNNQLPSKFINRKTKLIINIPVAGFKNQEKDNIKQTIRLLAEDNIFKSWNIRILIFSNRPEETDWDNTKNEIQEYIKSVWIENERVWIIEWEVPKDLWRIDWPFNDAMAINKNQVPIWFIRDTMNIITMIQAKWNDLPVVQMDWDFYGFKNWWLKDIIDVFEGKKCTFLQCKSDWEWIIKTDTIPLLRFWSDLMAELPMFLKNKLNETISYDWKKQIVFSDAIQRWIQVPQVELLSQIIKKWWYWLLRLSCDELDVNLRSAFLSQPDWLKNTWNTTFLRDNRRAIATLSQYNIPPIWQRKNWFEADDKIRKMPTNSANQISSNREYLIDILNLTLDRFILPEKIEWVYEDWKNVIVNILKKMWISWKNTDIEVKKINGCIKLNIKQITNSDLNFLTWKYNAK